VFDYFLHRKSKEIKLSMVMMVKNEEDIIKRHIEFHAKMGVDNFFILENNSDDNTYEILKDLQNSYDIFLERNSSKRFEQKRWMTQLVKRAKKIYNPDWVINSDVDEFWIPKNGLSLKESLNFKGGILLVPRVNMLFYEGVESWEDSEYMVSNSVNYQRDLENENIMLGKIGRKVIVNPHGYIKTNSGNHSAEHIAFWQKREIDTILIRHYLLRGYQQFEKKVKIYVEVLAENPKAKIGKHIKKWVKSYRENRLEEEWNRVVIKSKNLACLEDLNIIQKDTQPKELFNKL